MGRRSFIAYVMVTILVFLLCVSVKELFAVSDPYPAGPIFDGSVDQGLHLGSCRGEEKDLTLFFSGKESKELEKYKTRKFKKIQEEWRGKNGVVTIERYYFDSHEDAVAMAYHPYIIGLNGTWPGWSASKDIGDKTCWRASDIVSFVKGKVLVQVFFSSALINNKEEKKAYTRKIAEAVERKL